MEWKTIKCKYCGYEAPVISYKSGEEEFIFAKRMIDSEGNEYLEAVFKCPKCGREQ